MLHSLVAGSGVGLDGQLDVRIRIAGGFHPHLELAHLTIDAVGGDAEFLDGFAHLLGFETEIGGKFVHGCSHHSIFQEVFLLGSVELQTVDVSHRLEHGFHVVLVLSTEEDLSCGAHENVQDIALGHLCLGHGTRRVDLYGLWRQEC